MKVFLFYHKKYIVCTHLKCLDEAILMNTLNIPLFLKIENISLNYHRLSPYAMTNPQWLKLPMSRTNFHVSKDVRAIEVQL